MSRSKVAQLRQRNEEAINALCLLMNGPAVVSKYASIAHKHHDISLYKKELEALVGHEQTGPLCFSIYHQAVEGE